MKVKISLIIVFVIVVIGLLWLVFASRDPSLKQSELQAVNNVRANVLGVQTNDEGEVTVSVEPDSLSSEAEVWSFNVSLSTHSVDISQDLETVSILRDDKGNEFSPLYWEGDPPGGHHLSGVLTFKPFSEPYSTVTLIISEIDGISERVFSWEIAS